MFLLIPVPFLALSCLLFILCAALPPLRRFALPFSLWTATWGLLITGLLVLRLSLSIGLDFVLDHCQLNIHALSGAGGIFRLTRHSVIHGTILLLVSAALATGITFLQSVLIRRITFALFRIYVSLFAFGVGLVAATPTTFLIATRPRNATRLDFALALISIPILAALLSWFCVRFAAGFRSKRPEAFNPGAQDEYDDPATLAS